MSRGCPAARPGSAARPVGQTGNSFFEGQAGLGERPPDLGEVDVEIVRRLEPLRPPPLGARVLQEDADGEAVQPGGEGAVAAEAGEDLPGAHEGVLGQLFRAAGVAGQAQGEPIDPPVVQAVQLLEGLRIAAPRPRHQQIGRAGRLKAVEGWLHGWR